MLVRLKSVLKGDRRIATPFAMTEMLAIAPKGYYDWLSAIALAKS